MKKGSPWYISVYLTEIKKLLSYRVEFWLNFVTGILIHLLISYLLWKSIFSYNKVDTMQGYTLPMMVIYYLIVSIFSRITRGEDIGSISRDIYEGSLTKYIIYPISFFRYKLVTYFAYASFYFAQFIFVFLIFILFFGIPDGMSLSFQNFIMSSILLALSTIVYYLFTICIEMITFWVDKTWSLMVMLRMCTMYLGGGIIPMGFFPTWGQQILSFLPFPHIISTPVRLLLGIASSQDFSNSCAVLILWIILLPILARIIWQKGKLEYAGVGI